MPANRSSYPGHRSGIRFTRIEKKDDSMADEIAVIVGAGTGLSAALARRFAAEGMRVATAARDPAKLGPVMQETKSQVYACDAAKPEDVSRLFAAIARDLGPPDIVVYNASYLVRGPFIELDPAEVARTLEVTAFGGFL